MQRAEMFLDVFDSDQREIDSKPGVWNFRSRSRSPRVTEYVRTEYVSATTVQTAKIQTIGNPLAGSIPSRARVFATSAVPEIAARPDVSLMSTANSRPRTARLRRHVRGRLPCIIPCHCRRGRA